MKSDAKQEAALAEPRVEIGGKEKIECVQRLFVRRARVCRAEYQTREQQRRKQQRYPVAKQQGAEVGQREPPPARLRE